MSETVARPFYLEAAQLKGVKNMVPGTYPAEPVDGAELVTKALVVPIPRKLWSGDFLVEMDGGDISWMEDHFNSDVGDMIWIREKHRYHEIKGKSGLVVEFADGDKKETPLHISDVRFTDGRWLPPLALHRVSARFVLKVREVGVRWASDKKTDIMWVVGVERVEDVAKVLAK